MKSTQLHIGQGAPGVDNVAVIHIHNEMHDNAITQLLEEKARIIMRLSPPGTTPVNGTDQKANKSTILKSSGIGLSIQRYAQAPNNGDATYVVASSTRWSRIQLLRVLELAFKIGGVDVKGTLTAC